MDLSCLVLLCLLGVSGATFAYREEHSSYKILQNVDELVTMAGYKAQNYELVTKDGYTLWMSRIGNNTGPPVLMQHGLLVAADSWVTRGLNKDLAFLLLNEGYDVWLSNGRGTIYNEHMVDNHKSEAHFWDFSFHESGYYDIPAFIDKILEVRGMKQLFYIGHSQGTTVFLVMASTRPDYNDKIRSAVLLAPIAYPPAPGELNLALHVLLTSSDLVYNGLSLTGQLEVGSRSSAGIESLRELCTRFILTKEACLTMFGLLAGEHRSNLNDEEWESFIKRFGSRTSVKNLYHFSQVYRTGEFKQFDYGEHYENFARYENVMPPFYRMDFVRARVALFWGRNDLLLSETSLGRLASQLPNLIISKAVPDPQFSHLDMVLGANANEVLFPDVINVLKSSA